MTTMLLTRDKAGKVTYSIPPSDNITSTTLTTGVAQSFTVPSDYPEYVLNFSVDPGLRVFVSYTTGVDATIPGATFAQTSSELNPSSRTVKGGSVISCITPDATCYLEVAIYVI